MSTVQFCAPAAKSTLRLVEPPAGWISPEDRIGLVRVDSPQAATNHGYQLGLMGIDLWTQDLPLDLVDHALDAHRRGQDDRVAATILASAPTDDELVDLTPEVHLSPSELATGLRSLLARIDSEDAIAEFARLVLENAAQDVELFDATTFRELQAHEWEMAGSAFSSPPCPTCSRESR